MVKKLFFVLLVVSFLFTVNGPILAQEEREVEDIEEFSLEELLNVEITTAGKRAQKVSDIPASVVLITREDIERYGYVSLKEVLENVPGVYAIDDMSYYGTSFGMRGFWNAAQRNVIVMVNGVPQSDGFWQTSDPANFNMPVEAIDRVEVVRGPMSVIYGSGAFFGAINIITSEPAGESVNVISASGGTQSSMRVGATFSGREGDFNYAFAGGYFSTAGPDEPLSRMSSFPLADYGINDTNNTTKERLEESSKYANLLLNYKGFYAKMSTSQIEKEDFVVFPSISDGHVATTTFNTLSAGYRKDISDKVTIDFSLTYRKYSKWLDFDFFDPIFYGHEFIKSEIVDGDLTTIFTPSDQFNVTVGLHYQSISKISAYDFIPVFPFKVLYSLPEGSSMSTPSLFVQADYSPTEKLRLVAGLRLEQMRKYELEALGFGDVSTDSTVLGTYENDDIQFIPQVAAIYSINDTNIIKFLYGKAIRHPDFQPNLENIFFSDVGAVSLEPEYINTFELNYITSLGANMTVNFSVFYNRLQNLITRKIEVEPVYVSYYGNGGDLETLGAEMSIMAKPFENFYLNLSGTYQETKDNREGFEDIDVAYSPKLLAHLRASYRVGSVVVGATARYIDKMVPLWDVETDARIGQEVDSYFVMDGNIRIDDLFGKGYYINIKCSNLFDTEYLYPANVNNNLWADLGTIGRGLGRAFLVTIGRKF